MYLGGVVFQFEVGGKGHLKVQVGAKTSGKAQKPAVVTAEEEAEVQVYIDICTIPWHTSAMASDSTLWKHFSSKLEMFEKNILFLLMKTDTK